LVGERESKREGEQARGRASERESEREGERARGKASERESKRAQSAAEHYTHDNRERAGRMPSTQARPTNGRRMREQKAGDRNGGQSRGATCSNRKLRAHSVTALLPLHVDTTDVFVGIEYVMGVRMYFVNMRPVYIKLVRSV